VIIRGKVHRSGPVGPLPVPVGPQQHRAVRGEPGRDLGDVVVGVGPPRLADARAQVVEGDQRGVGGRVDAAGPVGDDRAVRRGPDSRGPRLPGRVAAAAAHVHGGDTAAGVSHIDPSPVDGGRGRWPAGERNAPEPDPGGRDAEEARGSGRPPDDGAVGQDERGGRQVGTGGARPRVDGPAVGPGRRVQRVQDSRVGGDVDCPVAGEDRAGCDRALEAASPPHRAVDRAVIRTRATVPGVVQRRGPRRPRRRPGRGGRDRIQRHSGESLPRGRRGGRRGLAGPGGRRVDWPGPTAREHHDEGYGKCGARMRPVATLTQTSKFSVTINTAAGSGTRTARGCHIRSLSVALTVFRRCAC